MKDYIIDIELDTFSCTVNAKNIADARKKAISKLNKGNCSKMIKREYPSNRKAIWIDEI